MSGQKMRQYPRHEVRLEVKIPTATMLKVLWTANMSKGGMAIETPNEIKPDSRVNVALMLPNQEIQLSGTVKHCTPRKNRNGFFVGVQFDELSAEARQAIEKIIGTVKEFKKRGEEKETLFDDSDVEIK